MQQEEDGGMGWLWGIGGMGSGGGGGEQRDPIGEGRRKP